ILEMPGIWPPFTDLGFCGQPFNTAISFLTRVSGLFCTSKHLDYLEERLEQLNREIEQLTQSCAEWTEKVELLKTTPGVVMHSDDDERGLKHYNDGRNTKSHRCDFLTF
ncbi:hypothetical protein POG22_10025, partial [Geitlerinema sp. CS-897]|nr:hypothetical protein [Geitlerinema sp. CS-897]